MSLSQITPGHGNRTRDILVRQCTFFTHILRQFVMDMWKSSATYLCDQLRRAWVLQHWTSLVSLMGDDRTNRSDPGGEGLKLPKGAQPF
uniref:Uncharacterized protein n=1 Tax=Timema genevievae TaxID=629358 RepID=A0A7R9K8Y3_TIMGE|nr:unnamed protein product [Timema genevievae]